MMSRYSISVSLGATMTFCLLFLMQTLIASGEDVYTARSVLQMPAWIGAREEQDVIVDEPEFEKPPPPLLPPSHTPPPGEVDFGSGIPVPPPVEPPKNKIVSSLHSVFSDGPLISVIKVQPVYPNRAKLLGLDGYVTVQFDVSAEGAVINVSILESSHPLFEKEAKNAAYRFRFKPRVVDGIPVATTGIRNRFRFEMER